MSVYVDNVLKGLLNDEKSVQFIRSLQPPSKLLSNYVMCSYSIALFRFLNTDESLFSVVDGMDVNFLRPF